MLVMHRTNEVVRECLIGFVLERLVRNEGMYLWATHRGFGAAQGFTRDTEDFDYWVYDAIVRVLVAIFLAVT